MCIDYCLLLHVFAFENSLFLKEGNVHVSFANDGFPYSLVFALACVCFCWFSILKRLLLHVFAFESSIFLKEGNVHVSFANEGFRYSLVFALACVCF